MSDQQRLRVAVVGGGISGLAAAHRILELEPSVEIDLFESGPRLGGVLGTEHRDGFLIEHGADNFLSTMPWAIDFCRRIGFEGELVPTNGPHRRAFVVRKGKLRAIPAGFMLMAPSRIWPILTTPILSPWGKLRLASEVFVPKGGGVEDESLASFVTRRLGRETYERLVQPLMSGIYTADPKKLSLAATMPQFLQMEREHGSLIRATWRQRKKNVRASAKDQSSGARYSQFVAPRNGMSAFIDATARRLTEARLHLNSPVERMIPTQAGGQWRVDAGGPEPRQITVDGVILAAPAHHAARLLRDVEQSLANDLAQIEYGSCALITFGYRREQIGHPLDGFGVVVPSIERRQILSASFSSIKYPGRAPNGNVLIRSYVGGACQRELLELDDGQLLDIVKRELTELLGIEDDPLLKHIRRCVQSMPQYHVGHASLVQRISARANQLTGFAIASNSLHGVGIPQCIHTAEKAAQQLLSSCAQLKNASPTTS